MWPWPLVSGLGFLSLSRPPPNTPPSHPPQTPTTPPIDPQPFVKQHFLQTLPGDEPRSLRGRNLIVRHGSAPPYFYVVENGAVHRVPRGKDNALTAVVLFLFLARRDRWLPTYNPGYRRLLEAVFGSAFDRSGGCAGGGGTAASPSGAGVGGGVAPGGGVGRGVSGGWTPERR